MIGSSVGDGSKRAERRDLQVSLYGWRGLVGEECETTLRASSSPVRTSLPHLLQVRRPDLPTEGAWRRHGAGVAAPRRERPQSGPAVPDRLLHVACDRDAVQHAQPLPLLPLVLFEQVPPHHGARMLRTTRVLPRTTRPSRYVAFAARSIPLASKRGLGAHPSKIYGAAAPALTLTLAGSNPNPEPDPSPSRSMARLLRLESRPSPQPRPEH